MRILKPFLVIFITTLFLVSCATTKTTTQTTTQTSSEVPKTPEGQPIVNTTPVMGMKMVAKKGEMTDAEIKAWPHMDIFKDSVPGISLEKAYEFVNDKTGQTVIVGVIDSGIDVEHEDLKDVVWINEDEIANNGKDDDGNGYVDDIYGWNFLGGEKGAANPEQLELTRMVKQWTPKFDGKTAADISEEDTSDFELYTKLKKIVDNKSANAYNQVLQYTTIKDFVLKAHDTIQKIVGKKQYTLSEVNSVSLAKQELMQGKGIIMNIIGSGETVEGALPQLDDAIDHYKNQLDAQYKLDFNGRVAGDNPYDINDKNYGNNDVIGSKDDESHGTHVSGIIAAKRNNGIGMNGVAENVKIMAIRAVPDGDEYDKDVALAIRYAVDNGAKVINMSFGKSYSPNSEWVFDAIKYAANKDVLLVHAAGNSSENMDIADNYPNDAKDKINEIADNVITVGAMTRHYDERLVASFSNFGLNNVDVFAPGLEIYSTFPKNSYESIQGTSMAAPEVAGVAALVRSYYPTLTASQVKHILMDSGIEFKGKVIAPGSKSDMIEFSKLSVSGKILNAYNALKMAEKIAKKS